VKASLNKFAKIMLIALVAQTSNYSWDMMNMIVNLIMILLVTVFPLLLIYGLLKATVDVFSKKQSKYISLAILLIAQTASNDIAGAMMQLVGVMITLFFIIIPGIIILMLWKALTKLIKL